MSQADEARARRLVRARRVIVKVGSSLLVDGAGGRLNRSWLESLAADVAAMRRRGQDVVLVSSGEPLSAAIATAAILAQHHARQR